MSQKNWSTLSLNSYKIDTTTLHNSIKELNSMKQQLESTLSHYRLNQSNFIEENERLKDEIQMLQRKLKERPINHQNCEDKIKSLEQALAKEQKDSVKFRQMYEVQRKNHEEVREFYERKLRDWQDDHHLLVNKYQQRLNVLLNQIQQIKAASIVEKSRKSYHSKKESSAENPYSSSDNLESVYNSNKKSLTSKNYPSKSPPYPSPHSPQRYKTPHWKIEEEPDEELFEASIRKLFYSIKEMGITSREVLMLPQMKRMRGNKAPLRKEIITFMKNPPFEEKDKLKIQKNINFIEDILLKKFGRITGEAITDFIIDKVEEYENAEKINSDQISVSGITPSLNKASSYGLSSVSQSKHETKQESLKKAYRPSITDALKIESEGSFIK